MKLVLFSLHWLQYSPSLIRDTTIQKTCDWRNPFNQQFKYQKFSLIVVFHKPHLIDPVISERVRTVRGSSGTVCSVHHSWINASCSCFSPIFSLLCGQSGSGKDYSNLRSSNRNGCLLEVFKSQNFLLGLKEIEQIFLSSRNEKKMLLFIFDDDDKCLNEQLIPWQQSEKYVFLRECWI